MAYPQSLGRCPKKLTPFLSGRGVSSALFDGWWVAHEAGKKKGVGPSAIPPHARRNEGTTAFPKTLVWRVPICNPLNTN